jgi:hypothetical protein
MTVGSGPNGSKHYQNSISFSLMEELLGRNKSGSGLKIREYGHGNPLL